MVPDDLILFPTSGKAKLFARQHVVPLLVEDPAEGVRCLSTAWVLLPGNLRPSQSGAQILSIVGQQIGKIVGSEDVLGVDVQSPRVVLFRVLRCTLSTMDEPFH